MDSKFPYEIDVRKDLLKNSTYFVFIDGQNLESRIVPKGLESFFDFTLFLKSFSQGALEVVLERDGQPDLIYKLQSEWIKHKKFTKSKYFFEMRDLMYNNKEFLKE